jgi:hypothetical protein
MKIEIKNLKHAAHASEETHCFEATIYIDGARAGTARNAGHGGPTDIEPRACAERLNAYAATLPRATSTIVDEKDPTGFFTYKLKADVLARTLADPALVQKLKAEKVLNLLPLPEALILYKAAAS